MTRWCYGYQKATANVTKVEHWKGAKAQLKTRWDLLDRYDALHYKKKGPSVKAADAAVVEDMKEDALFSKYYEKVKSESP